MSGRRRALLIATDKHEDSALRELVAPAADAQALADALRDPQLAGFDVTTLVNEPHHVVGQTTGEFYRSCKREDLALLYFTGHGLKDDTGKLYFAATNTKPDILAFTSISAAQINEAVESCASRRKVLILDCCYSGAFPAGVTAKGDTTVHTLDRFQGRGRVVLTASDAMQYSFEGRVVTGSGFGSVFTKHLVEAIRTGAADLDGDGDVSLDELYDYVRERVIEEMPQQRPKKQQDVDGRIVISRNLGWTLPNYIQAAVESPITAQKLAALEELKRLYRIGNEFVRAQTRAQIDYLTGDDSRTVSAAAAALRRALDHPDAQPLAHEIDATPTERTDSTTTTRPRPDRVSEPGEEQRVSAAVSADLEVCAETPPSTAPAEGGPSEGTSAEQAAVPDPPAVRSAGVAHNAGRGAAGALGGHHVRSATAGDTPTPGTFKKNGAETAVRTRRRRQIVLVVIFLAVALVGTVVAVVLASEQTLSRAVTTTIPAPAASAVAVSPDGRHAYVAAYNKLLVIETRTNTVTATIPVGVTADSVAVSADGRAVYTVGRDRSMSVIDTGSNRVTATIPLDNNPAFSSTDVAASPDGPSAYVTSFTISGPGHAGSLSVIDTRGVSVTATIPVAYGALAVAVSSEGSRAYVGTVDSILVIDTSNNRVSATIPLDGANSVAVSPDGRRVYVASRYSGSVFVIDTGSNRITATVRVGDGPECVAVSPDGRRAYVTHLSSGTMSVIDTNSNTVAATVHVGESPQSVAVTPDGRRAYVTTGNSDARPGSVLVIDTTLLP